MVPRSDESEKTRECGCELPPPWEAADDDEAALLRLDERIERARFLGLSVCCPWRTGGVQCRIPLRKGEAAPVHALAGHGQEVAMTRDG